MAVTTITVDSIEFDEESVKVVVTKDMGDCDGAVVGAVVGANMI